MVTIYKYPLKIQDKQELSLPSPARALSVGVQGGKLVLWAVVDPDGTVFQPCQIVIYGTGHPIEDEGEYKFLGTVQMPNGLVWHVFEVL